MDFLSGVAIGVSRDVTAQISVAFQPAWARPLPIACMITLFLPFCGVSR